MMNGISKNKIIFHSKLKRVLKLGTDHLTWKGGGYGFLSRSEIFFRTTRELEYFFLSRKVRIFFSRI
jgi:hypothetical protein